jgi:hypothetical protein
LNVAKAKRRDVESFILVKINCGDECV